MNPDFGQDLRFDGSRLTYDRVTWYTGAAAAQRCPQGCPDDYTVEDQQVSATGTIDRTTTILVLEQTNNGPRPVPGTVAQLAAALGNPTWGPYWEIQRAGDHITRVEHVYVP